MVDARHRGFSFLRGGAGRRATIRIFLQRQGQEQQQTIAAIDVQSAIQVMAEFDGFSGVAAGSGQGRQGDGMGA